ncbi:hypothetical protein C8Q73DRAFT_794912 [Cubamyces lactineus]|nr:hypothetical protein C8Q73DRAFT_794912 [Cubamyces lactineus]
MYDLPAPPAPHLSDLEPHFLAHEHQQQMPELFGPFPLPVRSTYPFASLFNAYGGIMRIVPPSTLGPLEQPHIYPRATQRSEHPIAIFIYFPTSMPTQHTPWILDPVHTSHSSNEPVSIGAAVIVPLLGKGIVVDIIDITRTTAVLVVQPVRCPQQQVYIRAPMTNIALPKLTVNEHLLPPERTDKTWTHKLRRAISAQFEKRSNVHDLDRQ